MKSTEEVFTNEILSILRWSNWSGIWSGLNPSGVFFNAPWHSLTSRLKNSYKCRPEEENLQLLLKAHHVLPKTKEERMTPSTIQERQAEIGDLRHWLAAAEAMGELQIVKGADWNLEIGGISQINYRRRPNKAQLFDEIKGYPKGFRILTASMGSARRMAMTFHLAPTEGDQGLVEALRGKPLQWETEAAKFPPRVVKSGPLLEEVYRGAEVNVLQISYTRLARERRRAVHRNRLRRDHPGPRFRVD